MALEKMLIEQKGSFADYLDELKSNNLKLKEFDFLIVLLQEDWDKSMHR